MHSHTMSGMWMLYQFGGQRSMPVTWNFAWEICLFSTIYLFIQSVILFTSLWTYGFLFCTLEYNPT